MEIGNKIGQNFGAQGQAACTLGGAAIGMLLDVLTTDQIVDGINDFLYDVTENYEDSLIFQ